jgi:hypothetical protein
MLSFGQRNLIKGHISNESAQHLRDVTWAVHRAYYHNLLSQFCFYDNSPLLQQPNTDSAWLSKG